MNNIGYYVLIAIIAIIILSLLHDFVSWRQRRAYWKRMHEHQVAWERSCAEAQHRSYRLSRYPFHEAGL